MESRLLTFGVTIRAPAMLAALGLLSGGLGAGGLVGGLAGSLLRPVSALADPAPSASPIPPTKPVTNPAPNSATAPVTQAQFSAWKEWTRKFLLNLDYREKKLETSSKAPTTGGGGEVDLSSPTSVATTSGAGPADTSKGKGPFFETYFDLNFINQPNTYDALAFDNYHSLVFFNLYPTPDITFSFNLLGPNTYPIFYELDYLASSRLTLRAGKIWIPFDDLSQQSPHNIFGGRVGLQQLMPTGTGNGGNLFLPSLWTELGVGARFIAVDTRPFRLETDFTITNGFTNGGQDPVTRGEGPDFSLYTPPPTEQGAGSSGSHRNKAFDLRAHMLVASRFGLGVSYYTSQWNPDDDPQAANGHLFLNMIGVDAQVMLFRGVELRAGFATMNVEYPEATANRSGTYVELGVPFLRRWKFLARGGTLQLDSRLAQPTDMTLVGGTLLFNPGPLQFSIEHSQDLNNPGVQVGFTSYTDLRMIALF